MEAKEILITLFSIIFIMGMFIGLMFLIYFSVSYFELKGIIKDCNKDFGIGNWTFTETKDKYICSYHSSSSYSTITTSTSQECLVNGIKVNCSEIK